MALRAVCDRRPVRSGPVSFCSVPSVLSPCFSVLKFFFVAPGADTCISGKVQPRDNAFPARRYWAMYSQCNEFAQQNGLAHKAQKTVFIRCSIRN